MNSPIFAAENMRHEIVCSCFPPASIMLCQCFLLFSDEPKLENVFSVRMPVVSVLEGGSFLPFFAGMSFRVGATAGFVPDSRKKKKRISR